MVRQSVGAQTKRHQVAYRLLRSPLPPAVSMESLHSCRIYDISVDIFACLFCFVFTVECWGLYYTRVSHPSFPFTSLTSVQECFPPMFSPVKMPTVELVLSFVMELGNIHRLLLRMRAVLIVFFLLLSQNATTINLQREILYFSSCSQRF